MILRRIGRKNDPLATTIIRCFPPHEVYYEPFFGAGGIFWKKPFAKYNWLNDLDHEVFNLWEIVTHKKEELLEVLKVTPLHEDLFKHWMKKKETLPVLKAIRFLMLSNFSIYGKGDCFLTQHNGISKKEEMLALLDATNERLQRCMFRNKDFREFFADIYVSENHIPENKRFIYADPPYLDSTNPYFTPTWTIQDFSDLLDTLIATEIPFAVSEFAHPDVMAEAEKRDLDIAVLGERLPISSKQAKTDILITNYFIPQYRQTAIFEMEEISQEP